MNVSILLTARISSTRLKNKALMEINGEPVIDILIRRLKKTKIPIILCSPDTLQDLLYMKPVAERNETGFFMGETENIIKRQRDCCKLNEIDYIILSEVDDFLVCRETVNAVYNVAKEFSFQKSIRTEGLPFGMNVIGYPRENLEKTDFSGDTNWGIHVTKGAYDLKFNYERPYRLSLDTQEDYEVMKSVYLNCKRNEFVGGIVKYLDKHPEIVKMEESK